MSILTNLSILTAAFVAGLWPQSREPRPGPGLRNIFRRKPLGEKRNRRPPMFGAH